MHNRGAIVLCAIGGMLAFIGTASAQWIKLVDKSASRLVANPSLVVNDNLEKAFAVGDFDRDGDSDLIMVRKFWGAQTGGFTNVLFINESGLLVDRTAEYASSSDAKGCNGFFDLTNDRDVNAVDVDGDGWLDLVTCTTMSDGVDVILGQPRVYINLAEDAQGNWQGFQHQRDRIPQIFPMAGPPAGGAQANPRFTEVDAGDLNGDGYVDLFFSDHDTMETAGTTTCRDLNGDGDTNDPGECQTSPFETGSHDFNNKLLYNYGESGTGPGYFYDTTNTVMTPAQLSGWFNSSASIDDMNGDGRLDVLALVFLEHIRVLTKTEEGPGFLGPKAVAPGNPQVHTTADLNGDSRLDLMIASDGQNRYAINTGNDESGQPNFTAFTISGTPTQFGGPVHVADMDNDGRPDVFAADISIDVGQFCPSTGRYSHVYRNVWDGVNPANLMSISQGDAAIPQAERRSWFDTITLDIDGDGWLDLIVGSCKGVIVYMNRTAGIDFTYPGGRPEFIDSGAPTTFDVTATVLGTGSLVTSSMQLHYRVTSADGGFTSVPLTLVEGTTYQATLPSASCGAQVEWFISGELSNGGPYRDPAEAPGITHATPVGSESQVVVNSSFESGDEGWMVVAEGIVEPAKGWESALPIGTTTPGGTSTVPSQPAAPGAAAHGSRAFVTWNGSTGGAVTASDLDGGPTRLLSPAFDLTGVEAATVSYARWFYCNDSFTPSESDALVSEISNDGGSNWVLLERVDWQANAWTTKSFAVTDFITPTANMRLRFTAADAPDDSTTEAAIDHVQVRGVFCKGGPTCLADIALDDGIVDGNDLTVVLGAWGSCTDCAADLNDDGLVDGNDLTIVLGGWGSCP